MGRPAVRVINSTSLDKVVGPWAKTVKYKETAEGELTATFSDFNNALPAGSAREYLAEELFLIGYSLHQTGEGYVAAPEGSYNSVAVFKTQAGNIVFSCSPKGS